MYLANGRKRDAADPCTDQEAQIPQSIMMALLRLDKFSAGQSFARAQILEAMWATDLPDTSMEQLHCAYLRQTQCC